MKYRFFPILILPLLVSCSVPLSEKTSLSSSIFLKESSDQKITEESSTFEASSLSSSIFLKESSVQKTTEENSTFEESSLSSSSSEDSSKGTSSVLSSDPYLNISKVEFYRNYVPATSYQDAYYRSKHGFLSGKKENQTQRPRLASNQPKEGEKFVFNSSFGLSEDGLSYSIVDSTGKIVDTIYKGGAYITLDEVAAYVQAFGDIPANYVSNKKTKPQSSIFGEYLRLNHSYFSDDTEKYKYEPELPDLSYKNYYEIDIGTTGSYEYSSSYAVGPYNDGTKIIRGASRIVYTRSYKNSNRKIEPKDIRVFYTFDHYNDFQEYLNYEGGFGTWFGNLAGGGKMNNKTGIYKTSYPSVVRRPFASNS